MIRCSRCSREGEVEYGADGLPYCTSCIFYGLNRQCFRCRMYLPATELQQYKGQWACPYCIMDMRTEDRGVEARKEGEKHVEGIPTEDTCERCGRTITTVYHFAGMRLCQSCADEAKREWKDIGGERPPMPMYRVKEKAVKEAGLLSFFETVFSEILALAGVKKKKVVKEPEIVAVQKVERRKLSGSAVLPAAKKGQKEPMIEGPEKKEKKKTKKSQDISFAEFRPEEKEKKKKKFGDFKND